MKARAAASYPLGELSVHHEVVHVLLRFGELQLPGHHGHHQGGAARTLWGDSKRTGERATSLRGKGQAGDSGCPRGHCGVRGVERGPEPSGQSKPPNLPGPCFLPREKVCIALGLAAEPESSWNWLVPREAGLPVGLKLWGTEHAAIRPLARLCGDTAGLARAGPAPSCVSQSHCRFQTRGPGGEATHTLEGAWLLRAEFSCK